MEHDGYQDDDDRRRRAEDGLDPNNNENNEYNEASPRNPDPNSPPNYNVPSPDSLVVTSTTPGGHVNPILPRQQAANSEATPPPSVEPQPADVYPPADSPDAQVVTSTTGTGPIVTSTVSSTRNLPVDQLAEMSLEELHLLEGNPLRGEIEPAQINMPHLVPRTTVQASTSRPNPVFTSGQPPVLNAPGTSGQPPVLNAPGTSGQPPVLIPLSTSEGTSGNVVTSVANPTQSSQASVSVESAMSSSVLSGRNSKRHSDPIKRRSPTPGPSQNRPTSLDISKSKDCSAHPDDHRVNLTSPLNPLKPHAKEMSPKRPAKSSAIGGNGSNPDNILSPSKKPRMAPIILSGTKSVQKAENESEDDDEKMDGDSESKSSPSKGKRMNSSDENE